MSSDNPFEALNWLFHPRSIAVVGVSPRKPHITNLFMNSQKNMGYGGALYAVNGRGEDIPGYPTYKRIVDIPGPVDHVILAVPAASVLDVLEDCASKGVRSVHAFTSGFAESDDPQGRLLQDRAREFILEQSFRFIGPNCMGLYCPESGLSFRPDFGSQAGNIGFASQSGGMTITGIHMAGSKGLHFSKAVSYGNEMDLSCAELLRYMAHDPAAETVWVYIEGTRNGEEFIAAMREVAKRKPLLVLKGGSTASGGRAAASHTGAMAGTADVWQAAIRQSGAIWVESLEEMVDTTMALQRLGPGAGSRLGLACISGGLSVNYTDQAVRTGFEVPPLSPELVQNLKKLINMPGTSLNNPLDLAAGFFQFQEYQKIFSAIDGSAELDAMIMVVALEYMRVLESREKFPDMHKTAASLFKSIRDKMRMPFLIVMPPVLHEEIRLEFEREFIKVNIPTYPSMRRTLKALANRRAYFQKA